MSDWLAPLIVSTWLFGTIVLAGLLSRIGRAMLADDTPPHASLCHDDRCTEWRAQRIHQLADAAWQRERELRQAGEEALATALHDDTERVLQTFAQIQSANRNETKRESRIANR